MTIRLIQLQQGTTRRVAFVDEPRLRLLKTFPTAYDLVQAALTGRAAIADMIEDDLGDVLLEYDPIYNNQSEWKILAPFDHPGEPARTYITGTGLTHLGSARNRDAMHDKNAAGAAAPSPSPAVSASPAADAAPLTDSMKMFRWGVEGGKPAHGQIGIAPEWFYKGTGENLRAHNQPLDLPSFAEDGGEEAEIAGIYLIDAAGRPLRVGMAQGNEFSDHLFEKKNYLNLAGSKLRTCSAGPELVLNPDFSQVPGHARIMRPNPVTKTDEILWSKPLATGESEMSHSLANLEHHHFKFPIHRRSGDVHVHFFGACALSFADQIRLRQDDIMQVQFKGFGRPLRNTFRAAGIADALVQVVPLA